jgi:hypothetical protein
MTCQYSHIPYLDDPDDRAETCSEPATHRGCDGDVCAKHKCRCAKPLPGAVSPWSHVT